MTYVLLPPEKNEKNCFFILFDAFLPSWVKLFLKCSEIKAIVKKVSRQLKKANFC